MKCYLEFMSKKFINDHIQLSIWKCQTVYSFQKLVFTFQTGRCNYFIFPSFFINFISSIQNRIVNKTNTSKSLVYQLIPALYLDKSCIWMLNYISWNYTSFWFWILFLIISLVEILSFMISLQYFMYRCQTFVTKR